MQHTKSRGKWSCIWPRLRGTLKAQLACELCADNGFISQGTCAIRMSDPSFLDRPLLKVSRPVAACSRCRTAKIKCDGKLPACSACERAGKTDTCSSSDEFPRGKERSYVGSLEAYCERLERRTAELRQRKEMLTGGAGGIVHESSITSTSSTGLVTNAHRQEVSNIDDLVGDFGYMSVISRNIGYFLY